MLRKRTLKSFLFFLLTALFTLSGALTATVISFGETKAVASSTGSESSTGMQTLLESGNISMDMRNADIRDVLSAIAVNMESNIIFAGQPVTVNFTISDVAPETALNYLLKSVGMDYIKNGSTIIAGTRESLTKDFFSSIALTRFSLKYIKSDVIASQIDALGIPVQKVTLDSNRNAIWVQGLPQELGKVRELIGLLDRAENVSGQQASTSLMLTPIALKYISAEQMNAILTEVGIPGGMILESNPMTLWVYANNSMIAQINEIKKKVDIADNAHSESLLLSIKKLKYLTSDEILPIIGQFGVDVQVITFKRSAQTIWLEGDEEAIKLASSLIDKIDTEQNTNDNIFFVHKLVNISAKEAERRFKYLNIDSVRLYTFNFPTISKSLLVFCPSDYKLEVLNLLGKLDIATEKIKVPVDYSDDVAGASRLQARRDLICSMTGIPASSFTISGNVSRTSDPHFIMYLEETSEVIQSVKELIKYIDSPTMEGSSSSEDSE